MTSLQSNIILTKEASPGTSITVDFSQFKFHTGPTPRTHLSYTLHVPARPLVPTLVTHCMYRPNPFLCPPSFNLMARPDYLQYLTRPSPMVKFLVPSVFFLQNWVLQILRWIHQIHQKPPFIFVYKTGTADSERNTNKDTS